MGNKSKRHNYDEATSTIPQEIIWSDMPSLYKSMEIFIKEAKEGSQICKEDYISLARDLLVNEGRIMTSMASIESLYAEVASFSEKLFFQEGHEVFTDAIGESQHLEDLELAIEKGHLEQVHEPNIKKRRLG